MKIIVRIFRLGKKIQFVELIKYVRDMMLTQELIQFRLPQFKE